MGSIFKVNHIKNCIEKKSFKNEIKIKTYSAKQNLKAFSHSKHALRESLESPSKRKKPRLKYGNAGRSE